jgi:hypothetical protein
MTSAIEERATIMFRARDDERVDVIRHDDPRAELVALLIEKKQRVLNHFCHARVLQMAGAITLVQVEFDAFAECSVHVRPRSLA